MEYIFLVSRILFGGFFIINGINHFRHVESLAGYAGSKGVPFPKVAVICTGLLIFFGGLGIVFGVLIRLAVLFLIIFLIPVTFKMHAYWNDTDPMQKMNNRVNFQKNIALAGGALMYLLISLPWPLSI